MSAMTRTAAPSTDTREATTNGPVPRHSVVLWAALGAVWAVFCVVVVVRWIGSSGFGPAPVVPGDAMPTHSLAMLRVVEGASVLVLLASAWILAAKPWLRSHEVTIEGLLILGGVLAFIADSALNLYAFLFSFNSHSVNLGSWSAQLPFHHAGVPTGYGEALLWGLPMYIYFCSGLAAMGLWVRRKVRERHPALSDTLVMVGMWLGFVVFDIVVENLIIRLSEAYAFVQTQKGLTLWAGRSYQFPVYESLLVGFVAMGFAAIRISAERDPAGRSFIERGVDELPQRLRLPTRALAAIGYSAVVLLVCYHLPFNWLSLGGGSYADLPSYLMPAMR